MSWLSDLTKIDVAFDPKTPWLPRVSSDIGGIHQGIDPSKPWQPYVARGNVAGHNLSVDQGSFNPLKIDGMTPGQHIGLEGPNAPDPWAGLAVPKDLQAQIEQYQQRAAQSPSQYSQGLMQGVNNAGAAIGFDPTSHALNARANRAFQSATGDLQRQATLKGYQEQIPRMSRATELDTTVRNIGRAVDSKMQDARLQADVTRSQVLSSTIKGIGGSIGAGMALAQNRNNNAPASQNHPIPGWQPSSNYGSAPDFSSSDASNFYDSSGYGNIG